MITFEKGLGVFAARCIPEGAYFGPYTGYKSNTVLQNGIYAWRVRCVGYRYRFLSYIFRCTMIWARLCIMLMQLIREIRIGYDM